MALHRDEVGANVHQPYSYIQATDPSGAADFPGAGTCWLDTTTPPGTLKRRNAANTAWDTHYVAGATGWDAEQTRDAIGAALVNSPSITWTIDDPANTI